MLTLLLFSMKNSRQRSKKSTSKAFSWHVQKIPRSSYDCFTGRLAPLLGQSRSTATVSCESWLAGAAKGSPCLLAVLCSTSASLPGSRCLLPSPLPPSACICKMQPGSIRLSEASSLAPVSPKSCCARNLSSSLAVNRDNDLEGESCGTKTREETALVEKLAQ